MTGFGPSVRSISTFGTRNGFTFPTQAAGSLATIPVGPCGGASRHSPASKPSVNWNVPKRPSSARAASIAEAASSPIAIPAVLAGPSGTAASDCV